MLSSVYFDLLVGFLVILWLLAVVSRDAHRSERDEALTEAIRIVETLLHCLFLLEMTVRLIGMGTVNFFTDFYCLVDFFLIFAGTLVLNLLAFCDETPAGPYVDCLLVLRALRLLQLVARYKCAVKILYVAT